MKCSKCGAEVKESQKFCVKCGTPVRVTPQPAAKQQAAPAACPKCGNPVKPGQKFCVKCGTPLSSLPKAQPEEKGWFTNGVRSVANAITGGNLNREIAREQEQAIRRQAREDPGPIHEAEQSGRTASRQRRSNEEETQRARERRNREAIDGVDVVRGRAIWNVQPGEIARLVTEAEFNEVECLEGVIIQEGCTALVYLDGELAGALSGGAYTFPKKSESEKKAAREEAGQKLQTQERRPGASVMDRGLIGVIGIGLNAVRRLLFGTKKGESEQKRQARQQKVDKVLKEKAQPKLIRAYLVSDRVLTLTFGGNKNEEGGIDYVPFTVPTKFVDVEIGVSLQMQVVNVNDFLRTYLVDQSSVTANQIQQLCMMPVQNAVNQMLRNLDYQQDGLPEPVAANLGNRIQQVINQQLQGVQCTRVLQITDRAADFERFRSVERELYCSEKELGYLQRTGEFRNRLAAETNRQEIDKAANEEDLRYALQQINRDQLLHENEMEQFVLLLGAQKRLSEAKSQEEEYEALLDMKKSRLVKEDEMAALEDALSHKRIERDSVTEIMRIQHQQSVDDARLKAQWALDDQKQDHDWEREDLQRRRNWGIEDEEMERAWALEEREYKRDWSRTQQQDEYEWQKRLREEELELRRQQHEHEIARQDKFDDMDILERKARIAQSNMQAMRDADIQELEVRNRVEINRDNNFANMTAEQIRAAQLSHLSDEAQVAMANSYSKDGENQVQKELYEKMLQLQQQQGSQSQEAMLKMAQMMQQGMMGVGGAQLAAQQQRADEYRQDAQRQQDRMDHTMDQSLRYTTLAHQADAMNPQATPAQNHQPATQVRHCPACGAEVPEGEAFCGECGNRM